jgi:hypothetical protein
MRKFSIIIQWLVVTALAALAVYFMVRPTPQPEYTPESWRSWNGVTVISYPGIARRESSRYTSVKMLEDQLSALKDAGYQTVRPADVRAYLDGRAPLPEKALLLIFEGGRKEAIIRATPVLQRTGFSAVIAVPTAVMKQWGQFYLKKKNIRKIEKMPQWQIGSMGHQANVPIPGTGPEQERRYLTQRLTGNGSEESPDSFRERIFDDYELSARLLKGAAGSPAQLYLYPYGDAGQSPTADPLAEVINRDAVSLHYPLAFIGSSIAFNGRGTDPWALTRLRVPGNWTPEQLLVELDSSKPRSQPIIEIGGPENWILERDAEVYNNELQIIPDSVAWLRGTENWTDVEVSVTLHPDAEGVASLYARSSSVRSWLRVTADSKGISIQERLGRQLITLFRYPVSDPTENGHNIRLRLRNNRAWVWLNNTPIAENIPLSPGTTRGCIGLGSQQGSLRVSTFAARPLLARWVIADSIRLIKKEETDQVQAVLPNWFRAGEESKLSHIAKQDLLRTSVTGIRTYPLLTGGTGQTPDEARAWAAAIDDELIKADLKMLVPTLAVEGPLFPLATELRNRSYRVIHLLTASQAHECGRAIGQQSNDEVIVVNDHSPAAESAINLLLGTIPSTRLAQREPADATPTSDIITIRMLEASTDD